VLIWGSIGCALATKFGGEVRAMLLGSGSRSGERERPFSEAPGLGANPGAIF